MFKLVPQTPQTTKCKVCGRTLTDPESIRAGAGPVCRGEKHCKPSDQPAFSWDKPELIICMNSGESWIGFDAQGQEIVSGRTEIDLAAKILMLFTDADVAMTKEFAEVIKGANRGVVRRKAVEKFIKEWREEK